MNLNELKKLKILFLDGETSQNKYEVYSWNVRDEVVLSHEQLVEERKLIMFSYNWLHDSEKKVYNVTWGKEQDDTKIIKTMTKLIKEADIVIGHNGDRFDIPWLKTRAMILGLEPILNVVSIDTLKMCRGFRLNSRKLDYLGWILCGIRKIEVPYKLWVDVRKNKPGALKAMTKYCNNDTSPLLRRVFLALLPYVDKIPVNIAMLVKGSDTVNLTCRHCGVTGQLIKRGFRYTLKKKNQVYSCNNCHHNQS